MLAKLLTNRLFPVLVLVLASRGLPTAGTYASVGQKAKVVNRNAANSNRATAAASGDDSYYCTSAETVTNLPQDGPAQPLQKCVYTALGSYRPGTIKTICPSGQKQSSSMPHPGSNCDYDTYTAALQATKDGCGVWYMIKSTSDGTPSGKQNEYTEPGNRANIPDTRACTASTWNWVTTDQLSALPAEGTRITPAWMGIAALPGYPSYAQPSVAGTYVPRLQTSETNVAPLSWCGSAAYWRLIGLEITTVAGAGGSTWLVGTLPGSSSRCSSNFGGDHMILDRIIVHGSANPTWHSNFHVSWVKWGIRFTGTYNALINSYCGDILMGESHCVAWGGGLTNQAQAPIKIVNNFLSASDEGLLTGGGPQSVTPEDAEIRRNYFFKPLFWDKQCYDPLPAFCNGVHFFGGANAVMSRSGGEVTATITPYENSLPFVSGDRISIVGASDPSFNTGGKNPRTYKLSSVDGSTLHWTQGAGLDDAKGLTGAILNNTVAPTIKNALELKNQNRALIEGNDFEYCWEGQSDQVGELVTLNAIGNVKDTIPAPVSNITMRYNILRHGNMGIQFGSEKVYRGKTAALGNVPVGIRVGRLGPVSVHDNLIDDLNGAYWNVPGSGLNSIGMRLVNGYPAPLYPSNFYLNHNTIIQSSKPDTRGTRGVGGSKLFAINDFSSGNYNRGFVNTDGTTVTLNCKSREYGAGCDSFSTAGAWLTTPPSIPIWINDVAYTIQSVTDSTHLTLTSSAGTQNNASYSAPCDNGQRGKCKAVLPLPSFDLWPSFTFTNSIGVGGFIAGTGVMMGAQKGGSVGVLDSYMSKTNPTAYVVRGNVFVTAQMDRQPTGEPFPPNNETIPDLSKIGFASFTDGNWNGTNDYHLCTGAGTPVSACKAASPLYVKSTWPTTDGLPPGADIDKVNAFTSGPPTFAPGAKTAGGR